MTFTYSTQDVTYEEWDAKVRTLVIESLGEQYNNQENFDLLYNSESVRRHCYMDGDTPSFFVGSARYELGLHFPQGQQIFLIINSPIDDE